MQFHEILTTLPAIDHLAAIELLRDNTLAVRIENKPGSSGSVRVYHALFNEFGEINQMAAHQGLAFYAEHTVDAIANPGKHPNIDRLLALTVKTGNSSIDSKNQSFTVKLVFV